MSWLINCPKCSAQVTVPGHNLGERVICGGCQSVFDVSTSEKPVRKVIAKPLSRRRSRYQEDDDEEEYRPRRQRPNRYWDDDDDDDDEWYYRPRRRRSYAPPPGESAAIASLVLGIISVLIFCLWPIGGITSAIGFVFGYKALRTPSHRMAVWGLVLSFVGIVFAIGFAVLTIAGASLYDGNPRITPKPVPWTPPPFFPKDR